MSNAMIALYRPSQWLLAVALLIVGSGCASDRIALDADFPVPLVAQSSTRVAIVITPELQSFVHNEKIAKRGDYSINVGAVQKRLFNRLAQGAFMAQPDPPPDEEEGCTQQRTERPHSIKDKRGSKGRAGPIT